MQQRQSFPAPGVRSSSDTRRNRGELLGSNRGAPLGSKRGVLFQILSNCSHLLGSLRILLVIAVICNLESLGILLGAHAIQPRHICSTIGLGLFQSDICQTRPDAILTIRNGARLGLQECQWQMRNYRWNCSQITTAQTQSMFGPVMEKATKEAAFAYAINAAGVSHHLTRECSLGRLAGCGCDAKKLDGEWKKDGWRWGGCSADIEYGTKFASLFVDARERKPAMKKGEFEPLEEQTRRLMNRHNNRAGGKIMKDLSQMECKCHGQSGACNLKTCWTTVAPFRSVGDELRQRYARAKFPATTESIRSSKRAKSGGTKPRKKDLVFLTVSPSYCEPDSSRGSAGTHGRLCNKGSLGSDGCDLMCCGRGYNAHVVDREWECNCQFHWCCEIKCQRCKEKAEVYTCK